MKSFALCALAACCWGAASAGVVEHRLTVEGRIGDVRAVDLDGDSLKDLLVVSVSGREADAVRRASVFWQRAPRGFGATPDLVWELEREIVALDPIVEGDAPSGGAGVYSLRSDGVYLHRFGRKGGARSTRVVEASLPHLVPPDDSVAIIDFAAAWSGGDLQFLVPAFPHPRLLSPTAGPGRGNSVLSIPPVARYWMSNPGGERTRGGDIGANYSFPMPVSADQDGDGEREMILLERDRVTVIETAGTAGPRGRRVYPVDALTDEEASSDDHRVRQWLVDLDGDGRMDLVAVVSSAKGNFEWRGRIAVFRARPDGALPSVPDQTIGLDDAAYPFTSVIDVDGDGSSEIVVPSTKLGLWSYLRILMTRKVSFSLNTLRRGPDGLFDTERSLRDSLALRLSPQRDLPVTRIVDADGDGTRDLIIGDGDDRVCVHLGTTKHRGRGFEPKAAVCFAADPYARYLDADLDGDGGRELIRHGPQGDGAAGVVVTFLRDSLPPAP